MARRCLILMNSPFRSSSPSIQLLYFLRQRSQREYIIKLGILSESEIRQCPVPRKWSSEPSSLFWTAWLLTDGQERFIVRRGLRSGFQEQMPLDSGRHKWRGSCIRQEEMMGAWNSKQIKTRRQEKEKIEEFHICKPFIWNKKAEAQRREDPPHGYSVLGAM